MWLLWVLLLWLHLGLLQGINKKNEMISDKFKVGTANPCDYYHGSGCEIAKNVRLKLLSTRDEKGRIK